MKRNLKTRSLTQLINIIRYNLLIITRLDKAAANIVNIVIKTKSHMEARAATDHAQVIIIMYSSEKSKL